jgi:hypothetical protein
MQMEVTAIFRCEPPLEAHRVKILFRDILEGSLDAVERDDVLCQLLLGFMLRQSLQAASSKDRCSGCGSARLVPSPRIQPFSP